MAAAAARWTAQAVLRSTNPAPRSFSRTLRGPRCYHDNSISGAGGASAGATQVAAGASTPSPAAAAAAAAASQQPPQALPQVDMWVAEDLFSPASSSSSGANNTHASSPSSSAPTKPPRKRRVPSPLATPAQQQQPRGGAASSSSSSTSLALSAELTTTQGQVQQQALEIRAVQGQLAAREAAIEGLQQQLAEEQRKSRAARADVLESKVALMQREEQLGQALQQLQEAVRDRSQLRSELAQTNAELAETRGELEELADDILAIRSLVETCGGGEDESALWAESSDGSRGPAEGGAPAAAGEGDLAALQVLASLAELSRALASDAMEDEAADALAAELGRGLSPGGSARRASTV